MKKLLILGLVLGMASMANAAMLLTVNGTLLADLPNDPGDPPNKPHGSIPSTGAMEPGGGGTYTPGEIWLEPSDWIEIDMEMVSPVCTAYDVLLELDNAQAAFRVPYWVPPVGWDPGYWADITFVADFTLMPSAPFQTIGPQAIRFGGAMKAGEYMFGPATIFTDLMLHCEEATDVVLTLSCADAAGNVYYLSPGVEEGPWQTGDIMDVLIIHQPEPMTMALLGLGGLALIRRRRA
jgi:hypothetical protein